MDIGQLDNPSDGDEATPTTHAMKATSPKSARSPPRGRGHRTACAQEETSCVSKCGGKEQSSDADCDLFRLD